jgi:hypothetical protein
LADELIVTDVRPEIKRDWRGWSWPRGYTKATVRFWFGEWVCDEKWRPFGHRAGRRSRHLFSDEVEERIVKEIEEKFRAEEGKLSRRTFTESSRGFG